jgi:four helix bundle protein
MALQVIKVTNRLPRTEAARSIARQLVASAGSVPANIAEGHGRFSRAAYRNHLSIARGSLWESESWVDLPRRAEYIDVDAEEALAGPFDTTARLTARCGSWTAHSQRGAELENRGKSMAKQQILTKTSMNEPLSPATEMLYVPCPMLEETL